MGREEMHPSGHSLPGMNLTAKSRIHNDLQNICESHRAAVGRTVRPSSVPCGATMPQGYGNCLGVPGRSR